MPKISIIIPIYNVEKYLPDCLDSVLSQTFNDFEVICVNDGSPDGCDKILNSYAAKDGRIKIVTQKNQGVVVAKNNGIKNSKGKYIFPLDGDDIIAPTCLEKMYQAMIDKKGDVIYSHVELFENEKGLMRLPSPSKFTMLHENCVVNSALYKKSDWEKYGGYDLAMKEGLEDWDFWLSFIGDNKKFYRIDEVLFFYRIRENSRNKMKEETALELRRHIFNKHKSLKRYYYLYSSFRFVLKIKQNTRGKYSVKFFKIPLPLGWLINVIKGEKNLERVNNLNIKKFKKKKITNEDVLNLYYFTARKNFGDLLNVTILKKIFNINIQKSTVKKSKMIAIGSLLECLLTEENNFFKIFKYKYLKPKIFVWGSGFIESEKKGYTCLRGQKVVAVRGYYSLNRLKNMKNVLVSKNVVIGDPGLLVKKIVNTSEINKIYKLGIIPHYVDEESQLLNKITVKDSTVINIQQESECFIKQLAECEYIISSAMHGLIAADSLGIPNIRMILSDEITGGDYKFKDYYSAFGIDNHQKINLNEREFGDEDLLGLECVPQNIVEKICNDLIDVFPFKGDK